MKVSYQWLSEYLDLREYPPSRLAEALTSAGLAVDGIESRNQGVQGVVVGRVLTVEPHPDADRLRVCSVDVGGDAPYQIVCGAPNVAPEMVVPVALPGAILPGDKHIGRAKLRGVESNGMLCSAAEIGLDTRLLPAAQTQGLYALPLDTPIGQDIVNVLNLDDVVLDVDLTPNRSDCLSVRGLVYEIAAITRQSTTFPERIDVALPDTPSPLRVQINTPLCARYDAQVLEGLQSVPSPLWMQMRLMAMGIRSIDVIVDVTNYVMLEWGQPLHAFDADSIAEGTIVVRQANEGETLVTLDGQSRALNVGMIVISDPAKAIGLAGVMGGENSEISVATKRVVLESARFDPRATRRTGQALTLRSEAQQRFEKGIDPNAVQHALHRATSLLMELAGASAVGGTVSVRLEDHRDDTRPHEVMFSPEKCRELLGLAISDTEMARILTNLGFVVVERGDEWTVHVPARRMDVVRQADLAEEVARLYGYDNIPSTGFVTAVAPGVRNDRQKLIEDVKATLVESGLFEVRTYAFTSPEALAPVHSEDTVEPIPLMYPMSDERRVLRTHLLPSLAEVARHNLAHRVMGGAIFEVGRAYLATSLPLTTQPTEREVFAMLWFGETSESLYGQSRAYDFYDAKGVVERVFQRLGIHVQMARATESWLHPGRSIAFSVNGKQIGVVGEVHPSVGDDIDVSRALYAELDILALVEQRATSLSVKSLPKFPGSRRDLALLVRRDTPVGEVIETIRQTEQAVLQDVAVFDVYAGQGVSQDEKSVAISLAFQAEDRTLTDGELDDIVSIMLRALQEAHGARLRGTSD